MTSEVFNTDCLEYMRTLPDKAFQLAIADPPYGIGEDGKSNHSRGLLAKPSQWTPKEWDKQSMTAEFFEELRRISSNQIIWGANHFISRMPYDSSCWIVWDKCDGMENKSVFADAELAWTNMTKVVSLYRLRQLGFISATQDSDRIHPTQKPTELYAWLLRKYATEGDRIFDPMMGSQSSRIAAYKMGFDYVGCELDKEYFDKGCERFNRECKGEIVTKDGNIVKQMSLFDL